MHPLKLLLITACLSLPAAASSAAPGPEAAERTITVNGTGSAGAPPDVAVVSVGVETDADTASAALSENSRQTRALVDALKAQGIGDKDLQTHTIQLQARYEHEPAREGSPPKRLLTGYQATNVVSARITRVDKVGTVLDAAVKAGGNRIDAIAFEIADPVRVLRAAREAAWADALAKARQLAELAGVELGAVRLIESFEHTPGPVREMAMARMSMDSVPVQGGEQVMAVDVRVSWELR